MPEKILELLEKGNLTESQIAEELNVTVEELKAGLEYLAQMGFIKSTFINPSGGGCDGNCGGGCSGCSSGCGSHTTVVPGISNSSYTIWEIL